MWIDNSVVDYTNWKQGMPKSGEQCVEIQSDSGLWSTNSCNRYKSYICKTAKGESDSADRFKYLRWDDIRVIIQVILCLLHQLRIVLQLCFVNNFISFFCSHHTNREATSCW